MEKNNFDLVVIGAGPGGYVAAIKAAKLGMKVACIEKRKTLGGTCLNVGCIPSKALLDSSEKYHQMMLYAKDHGISFKNISFDVTKMMDRKNNIVSGLTKGIEGLFKKNKVTHIIGEASFKSENTIKVISGDKEQIINTKNTLIATGSKVAQLQGVNIDEQRIVSSTGALSLDKIPKKMIVIGGGYIGLEMASVWSRLGTEVTVVEYADDIVPAMDKEIGKQLQKSLLKQGIKFLLGQKVISSESSKNNVVLNIEDKKTNEQQKLTSDIVLVAVGRVPNTDNLNLDLVKVLKDERGFVIVDKDYQTSTKNIFAIGDVTIGPMLAHKAEEEGVAVVEKMMGQKPHIDYNLIPGVIYTWPEVASVGLTEEMIKSKNIAYNTGKFPLMANSRARATGDTEGMVKILARKDNDEILGVHIIAPHAGTMIAEAVTAMEYKASAEDIARICHAHPTLNEALKEAALDVSKMAIHK